MTTPRYAVSLDLTGRRVLVVGGGPVAARRARDLVAAGARVDVVSPWLCEDLVELAATGSVAWHEREYAAGDVCSPEPAWLVQTATGDRAVDAAVVAECEAARVWCGNAGSRAGSPVWRPAVAAGQPGSAAEGVAVAVTADGDPGRAVAVRDAVLAALESGLLPVRRTRTTREGSALAAAGSVALVGGGLGDPGLLTVRGRALLAAADVVITDRLGPRGVLPELAPEVEVIDVGKTPGHHPVPQSRIISLLVEHAHRGRRVVRLKGGDPFVLGRGGEEALHCLAHGVAVEVVPGVTSAVSVPAAAGIPVTHRGVTSTVVVASAHDEGTDLPAALLTAPADATLVMLMGVTSLATTAAGLVAAGRSPQTPVAVVERGWTPSQRTTVGTLASIAQVCRDRGVESPAVVVVGAVVALRELLGDLTARPPVS